MKTVGVNDKYHHATSNTTILKDRLLHMGLDRMLSPTRHLVLDIQTCNSSLLRSTLNTVEIGGNAAMDHVAVDVAIHP